MKKLPWMIVAALLLCGCTDADWDHLMSFDRPSSETADSQAMPESPAPMAQVQAPAEQTSQPDVWCQQVAQDALAKAADNGFDTATQQNMARTSYRQCAVLKSDSL